jgi:hypothetical protein
MIGYLIDLKNVHAGHITVTVSTSFKILDDSCFEIIVYDLTSSGISPFLDENVQYLVHLFHLKRV